MSYVPARNGPLYPPAAPFAPISRVLQGRSKIYPPRAGRARGKWRRSFPARRRDAGRSARACCSQLSRDVFCRCYFRVLATWRRRVRRRSTIAEREAAKPKRERATGISSKLADSIPAGISTREKRGTERATFESRSLAGIYYPEVTRRRQRLSATAATSRIFTVSAVTCSLIRGSAARSSSSELHQRRYGEAAALPRGILKCRGSPAHSVRSL